VVELYSFTLTHRCSSKSAHAGASWEVLRWLAGIKTERRDPREIVGFQALFVVNLEPRQMAGEVSQGMLFDIGFADGITPLLAVPERAVPNGARPG
jgi:tRNA-binding EMAP/Myf-like protein